MIVNVTPFDHPQNDVVKKAIKKLFAGSRVNAARFDTETKGSLTATIKRTSKTLEVEIYNQNKSINYTYACKVENEDYLNVNIINRNCRVSNSPKEVLDYLTYLSVNYGCNK